MSRRRRRRHSPGPRGEWERNLSAVVSVGATRWGRQTPTDRLRDERSAALPSLRRRGGRRASSDGFSERTTDAVVARRRRVRSSSSSRSQPHDFGRTGRRGPGNFRVFVEVWRPSREILTQRILRVGTDWKKTTVCGWSWDPRQKLVLPEEKEKKMKQPHVETDYDVFARTRKTPYRRRRNTRRKERDVTVFLRWPPGAPRRPIRSIDSIKKKKHANIAFRTSTCAYGVTRALNIRRSRDRVK